MFEFFPVWARDFENAAINHVENRDTDEYEIARGEEVTVLVRNQVGELKEFTASGGFVPEYYVSESH